MAATAIIEGTLSKNLKTFLKECAIENDHLAVADSKLANAIHKKLKIGKSKR